MKGSNLADLRLEILLSLEVSYTSLCAELTKLQRKEKFNTNLDPDPEWLLICHLCSNAQYSSCHALSNKVSHVSFG